MRRTAGTRGLDGADDGFTLVELLVCVLLVGVLNGIALPVFSAQRNRAHDADARSLLRNAATALEAELTTGAHYTRDLASLPEVRLEADDDLSVVLFRDAERSESVAADESDAIAGFCLEVGSRSGRTLVYDSLAGGLQPGSVGSCAALG